jgi:hypothetical protein
MKSRSGPGEAASTSDAPNSEYPTNHPPRPEYVPELSGLLTRLIRRVGKESAA